jgi:hypothetical protein
MIFPSLALQRPSETADRLLLSVEERSCSGHRLSDRVWTQAGMMQVVELFVRPDPSVLDDLGPFYVGLDDGGEVRWRTSNRIETELGQFLACIGLCGDLRNLLVQLGHNRCWRARRRKQSEPGGRNKNRASDLHDASLRTLVIRHFGPGVLSRDTTRCPRTGREW